MEGDHSQVIRSNFRHFHILRADQHNNKYPLLPLESSHPHTTRNSNRALLSRLINLSNHKHQEVNLVPEVMAQAHTIRNKPNPFAHLKEMLILFFFSQQKCTHITVSPLSHTHFHTYAHAGGILRNTYYTKNI
jgi:hypothetical protein